MSEAQAAWHSHSAASRALSIVRRAESAHHPLLVVADDEHQAIVLCAALRFFAGQTNPEQASNHSAENADWKILHFPDTETLPYDRISPHEDIVSERLGLLSRLPAFNRGILVVALDTLLDRLPPTSYVQSRAFDIRVGDRLVLDNFRHSLDAGGYRHATEVRSPGEFSIRGSLIDIFPMGSRSAYRIDLFDDAIDSIRPFDAETQRSEGTVNSFSVLPGDLLPLDDEAIEGFKERYRQRFPDSIHRSMVFDQISRKIKIGGIEAYLPLFFDDSCSLLDYLDSNTEVILDCDFETRLQANIEQTNFRYEQLCGDIERPILTPDEAFWPISQLRQSLEKHVCLYRSTEAVVAETATGEPDKLLREIIETNPGRLLFCVESAGRREILLEHFKPLHVSPKVYRSWAEFLGGPHPIGLCVAELPDGFMLAEQNIRLVTEQEIFGKRAPASRTRRRSRDPESLLRDLSDLREGSPVVHESKGVGRYLGLSTMDIGGQPNEFLTIEYAKGDKLYVPVADLHRVHRYTGADAENAPLHSMGSERWSKARKKAEEKARDVAAELLDIHAKRAARPGVEFPIKEADYLRFCDSFPFTETPDQAKAIAEVLKDMNSPSPMDRVVCGDVGFGKTEVAMRAAFTAVNNGYQVCVLVPTTLLANQHLNNFIDRFADWPVKVAGMSRLQSKKQAGELLDELAAGKCDIVIGTHRLLSKDILFKQLGLVIVDEEHRFGVRHKEALKALRAETDLLTLTATPIPRTLNMSLAGLRDLSVIATPPEQRLTVQTVVTTWEAGLIREACQRELKRGGQVYFLHNRVEDIEQIGHEISEIVPEAKVAIAHGQMKERELEQTMLDFYHHRFNLLVCTTIIESGIDVPTANTIFINRADRLGLAQLHQLRGRVGRSHHRAYAYLLAPDRRAMTPNAEKRLEAIEAMGELGAGFNLATHDLEIRGAGELLGEGQSGQINEVGFTMYNDLLRRAVSALKSGKVPEEMAAGNAEIDLGFPALLPEDYVPDVHQRLVLYKRVSHCSTRQELNELKVELIDRFGLLPPLTENLFHCAALGSRLGQMGFTRLSCSDERIRFDMKKPQFDPMNLIALVQAKPRSYKIRGDSGFDFCTATDTAAERVEKIEELAEHLSASN